MKDERRGRPYTRCEIETHQMVGAVVILLCAFLVVAVVAVIATCAEANPAALGC